MIPTPEGRIVVARDIVYLLETVFSDMSRPMSSRELIVESAINKQASIQCLDAANNAMTLSFHKLSAAARRERNALVLAASLPQEILAQIFIHNDLSSTLVASAVCHRWRVAAISTRWLWTCVDLQKVHLSDEMTSMVRERCGNALIDIRFRPCFEEGRISNGRIPASLASLLPRARSISNVALDEWMIRYPKATPTTMPRIHPLLSDLYLEGTRVRESSGFFQILRLSEATEALLRLRVLQLHNIRISAITTQRIVELTPRVEELTISSCGSLELGYHTPTDSSQYLKRLRLLSLLNCSEAFTASFLHREGPIKVQPGTSVQLVLDKTPFNWPMERGADPSTRLHILNKGKVFVYEHEQSLTRIIHTQASPGTSTPETHGQVLRLTAFPQLVRINSRDLDTFTHLQELYIDFEPAPVETVDPGLSILFNQDLAVSCPRLSHISIQLIKPPPHTVVQNYEPANDLAVFLDVWIELNQTVFASIHIHDEIRPSRWTVYMDFFRGLTGEFEVYRKCKDRVVPQFPVPTQFLPDGSRI
ncbi:hypothetical protein PIIN_08270 [Serendipita indica DSM 11827]|uniref:F-box domain-containing protein n=1 Tax=Serendipita indica (strain DSM 11827) TaxID=1109443 RepID=G4TSM4_SERID|nr:hypothetical protein PIIN_08270 [Serendipita indica DSM 11827]